MDQKTTQPPTPTEKSKESLLSTAVQGASNLILLQFVSRMLTFSLNQIVFRYVSAENFGIASVNLELLSSTILFISREGFRNALIRSNTNQQQVVNLAYIPTALGLITTLLACGYYYISISAESLAKFPYYRVAVILYGLASFLELLVEPLFVLALNNLYFKLRVRVEGIAVLLRCIVTFGLTLLFAGNSDLSILAFAIAQLVFGLTMMTGYLVFFLYKEKSFQNLIPHEIKDEKETYWFNKPLLNLGITMTKQSVLKHVLTEGDKMLISVLSTAQDSGVYAFVVNYGSLIVRILFQPLEEMGRTFFSKLLLTDEKDKETTKKTASNALVILIQFHVLLGLIFACFATNYASTLIHLLAGRDWATGPAPTVLATYCLYIPFMGINGITEAFVQAVATKSDLTRLSYYMFLFSAAFMTSGFVFMYVLDMGAVGLIMANMVNLGIRIVYSWHYINTYFNGTLNVKQWFPSATTVTAFIGAWSITYWSREHIGWLSLEQKAIHIGIGGVCFLIVSGVIWVKEKKLIHDVKRLKAFKTD